MLPNQTKVFLSSNVNSKSKVVDKTDVNNDTLTVSAAENINKLNSSSTKASYAQMAADNFKYPTQEQAIVLDSIEGIPVAEYCYAIGEVTEPENIKFVSRISQGRVCLYLDSVTAADYLCESVKKVTVLEDVLNICLLISKAKRVIISNVASPIQNQTMLN